MPPNSLAAFLKMKIRPGNIGNAVSLGGKQSGNSNAAILSRHGSVERPEEQPRVLETVRELIHKVAHMKNTDSSDSALSQLLEEYQKLDLANRQHALHILAMEYEVDRANVRSLMQHYLTLQQDIGHSGKEGDSEINHDGIPTILYRTEKNLRSALTPLSALLFKRLNWQAGGLKFLSDLRADLRNAIEEQNLASFRALDTELKEVLETALSPAGLELHQITWNDPASLLEKVVAYEAVHPVTNLYDLKRRLGSGRRCFGYFHPSIPGEPLIFIQVALTNTILESIQDVLWDESPIPESEATVALFYSISSTQPGLAGINLGKFLIKRVVRLLQQEMPAVQTFATLSPIPGFMPWLLSKLASQATLATFHGAKNDQDMGDTSILTEALLLPAEERLLSEASEDATENSNAAPLLLKLLTSPVHEWTKSERVQIAIKTILLRLCARYLLKEKKRGKALDAVANFHAQNGAGIERLNWMGDRSHHGLRQSAGIMVNYVYRLDKIEENSRLYFEKGLVSASPAIEEILNPAFGVSIL